LRPCGPMAQVERALAGLHLRYPAAPVALDQIVRHQRERDRASVHLERPALAHLAPEHRKAAGLEQGLRVALRTLRAQPPQAARAPIEPAPQTERQPTAHQE